MKKLILLLAVIFVMSSFTTVDTNTSIEKVNVEKVALPEAGCRTTVTNTILGLYFFTSMSNQELADLEIEMLINCFMQE